MQLDEKEIIRLYSKENLGIEKLCSIFHVGKKKIRDILFKNNIEIRKKGNIKVINKIIVYSNKKYVDTKDYHYVAISKIDGSRFYDCENRGGHITSYINNVLGIAIPSLYDRKKYYMETGMYWWEQWFTVEKITNSTYKKCPFCDWKTKDIENKSGAFEKHLFKKHGMTKNEYIDKFPNDRAYFKTVNKQKQLQMENDSSKFVTCEICGKKLKLINSLHLKKHGITKFDYIRKYNNPNMLTYGLRCALSNGMKKINLNIIHSKTSKAENEIKEFIKNLGYECETNRTILGGKEIDLYIPSLKIGIEYNGLIWHTENFGNKNKYYHLEKTEKCKESGVELIQIFEDEYVNSKEIVLAKIRHILHCDNNILKISARKCNVFEIGKNEAEIFLNKNHIQGFSKSTIYLGCFYNNELIGVMSFIKNYDNVFILNRFATNYNYGCRGVGGKLFKYFISKYNPKQVVSFADRRWTLNEKNNLYTKLGFKFAYYTKPDYKYYNQSVERYKRFHKFGFRKKELNRKYGLDLNLTENEMTKILGYDKIWDCGLIKYVFNNNEYLL